MCFITRYLSKETRKLFFEAGAKFKIDYFAKFSIVASNDLNEATIIALNRQVYKYIYPISHQSLQVIFRAMK